MSNPSPSMAYVGYCQGCGSLVAAIVDDRDSRRCVAKEVGRMLRDGYRVERVTCEVVRSTLDFCKCNAADSEQASFAPLLSPNGAA